MPFSKYKRIAKNPDYFVEEILRRKGPDTLPEEQVLTHDYLQDLKELAKRYLELKRRIKFLENMTGIEGYNGL